MGRIILAVPFDLLLIAGAAKAYVDEVGQVNLGEILAEVAAGKSASFGEVKFRITKHGTFRQTDLRTADHIKVIQIGRFQKTIDLI